MGEQKVTNADRSATRSVVTIDLILFFICNISLGYFCGRIIKHLGKKNNGVLVTNKKFKWSPKRHYFFKMICNNKT
jgi:hypothetical protein